MSRTAIADTGLLVAYLDPDDQHHPWAVEQFERYPFFLPCEAVLAEACYLVGCELDRPERVLVLLRVGVVKAVYGLQDDVARVEQLMITYADVPMDLADACVVHMAEQRSECEVITVESDFHVYRRHGDQAIPVSTPQGKTLRST